MQNINGINSYGMEAKWVREQFKDYFNNEGSVDWQLDKIHKAK